MAGVPYRQIVPDDLKGENLSKVNGIFRDIIQEVNRLSGAYGPIALIAPLDMGGNPITNVGDPPNPTDALTKQAADPLYGNQMVQNLVEATGSRILQTTRRLNDRSQRESYSTFMQKQLSIPPVSNSSTVTVTASGGSSIINVTAGTFYHADGSSIQYAARSDTVTNPGSGSNFYYYYLRYSDNTLQMVGPFTADTAQNQINANLDGEGFVGMAQVNAGGGGTGGGGGGGTGGCCEMGTPLEFPENSRFSMKIEDCDLWVRITLNSGKELVVAKDTLVSVFKPAQLLEPCDLVEVGQIGMFESVASITEESRPSKKMNIRVFPHGTYWGNGIRLHNIKTKTTA